MRESLVMGFLLKKWGSSLLFQLKFLIVAAIALALNIMTKHKTSLNPQFISVNGANQFAVIPVEEFELMQQALADAEDLINVNSRKYQEGERVTQLVVEAKKEIRDIASKFLDLAK